MNAMQLAKLPLPARRYLALWFPHLPFDRLRLGRPDIWASKAGDGPAVTVENIRGAMRLAAVDEQAAAIGLRQSMSLADARASEPDLRIFEADAHADQDWLERLCDGCSRYTPMAMPDAPYGLMLDISGCAHLWDGEEGLVQAIVDRFERHGMQLRHAFADTSDAAHALARFRVAPAPDEQAAIRRLPVEALRLEGESNQTLRRAGLRTIADIAALPVATFAARFGEEAVEALHRLLGMDATPLKPRFRRPHLQIERRFAEPIGSTTYALTVLETMIAESCEILEERAQGGRRFDTRFFRTDGLAFSLRAESSLPLREAGAIMRLVREQVEALADPLDPGFGFDMIQLSVPQVEALAPTQLALEGGEARKHEAVAALIDRLSIRAGRGRIQRLVPCDSHIPEQAQLALPAVENRAPISWPMMQEVAAPPRRPLHLFDPPQSIDLLEGSEDGPPHLFRWRRATHEIVRFEGPERISPQWWTAKDGALFGVSAGWTRDYYRVEDVRGRRYWIFRHGIKNSETAHPRWYMHGLFA